MNSPRTSLSLSSRPELSSPSVSLEAPGTGHVIDVAALMAGEREVVLMHDGERYRLRVTSNNKLILTK